MARSVRLAALVGAAVLTCAGAARAGSISVALTAGADGSSAPSAWVGFPLDNPSGSPRVSLHPFGAPAGMLRAGTGDGFSLFGASAQGEGVVLTVADGSAYLAAANAPADALPSAGLATGLPDVGGLIPLDAPLVALTFSDPAEDASQVLSVYVTDYTGETTGTPGAAFVAGEVTVPGGGWWVIGLSPEALYSPPPPPIDPDPTSTPDPTMPTTAATPEPATLVLAGLGLPVAGVARRIRRRWRE